MNTLHVRGIQQLFLPNPSAQWFVALVALSMMAAQALGQSEPYPWAPGEKEAYEQFAHAKRLGRFKDAIPLGRKWLEICRQSHGRTDKYTADCEAEVAYTCELAGELNDAKMHHSAAADIRELILGREHPRTAECRRRLGEIARSETILSKIDSLLLEQDNALSGLLRGGSSPRSPDRIADLEKLALLAFDRGVPKEAHAALNLMVSAKRVHLRLILPIASEADRLAFLRDFNPYDMAASLGAGTAVADTVLMTKGIVLESLLEEQRTASLHRDLDEATSVRNSKIRELDEQLKWRDRSPRARLELRKKLAEARKAGDQARVAFIQNEIELLSQPELTPEEQEIARAKRNALAEQVGIAMRGKMEIPLSLTVTAQDVAAQLPAKMALIEYVRYNRYLGKGQWEESYGAVVIRKREAPAFVSCGPSAKIDPLVTRYLSLIQDVAFGKVDDQAIESASRELYGRLFHSLRRHLGGIEQLVFSPDSQLNFVPFGTLLGQDNRLLAEKANIYYVASGRDLIAKAGLNLPPKTTAVVMGAPDFAAEKNTSDSPAQTERSNDHSLTAALSSELSAQLAKIELAPLSGTRAEAQAVGTALQSGDHGNVVTVLGGEVTEMAIRNLKSPEILHLATHGFFLPAEADQHEETSPSRNPMYRSGIALSGAQQAVLSWQQGIATNTADDGLLLASELSELDLRSTELVTLSACETARGDLMAGEGVIGMRRALVAAGARNVLMTLWDIADEPTADFMATFYQRYATVRNAPKALAEVQRKELTRLRQSEGLGVAIYLAGPFVMGAQAARRPGNHLGMRFVSVPGTDVQFSIWETRVRDYLPYLTENPEAAGGRANLRAWQSEIQSKKVLLDQPVEVTWNQAKAFCAWLSRKEGLRYRLPTDHEWSIAVGIGDREDPTASPAEKSQKILNIYPWGSTWPPSRKTGNFKGGQDGFPELAPVGSFRPNRNGLFDMDGNVQEWCEDLYDPNAQTNKDDRVLRGSSFETAPSLSSYRERYPKGFQNGFRVVLEQGSDD